MILIQRTLGQNPTPNSFSLKSWFEDWDRFTQFYMGSFLLGVLFLWGGGSLMGGGSCVIGPTTLSLWYLLGPYICGIFASIWVLTERYLETQTYSTMADAFLECWDKVKTYSSRTHVAVICFYVIYLLFALSLAQLRSLIGV